LTDADSLGVLGATDSCPGPRSLIYPAPRPKAVRVPSGGTLVQAPIPGTGQKAYALHLPAPPGAPTIAYFHGNGEQLASTVRVAEALQKRGVGFFSVEYPGYGPAAAQGTPTEQKIYRASEAALHYLRDKLGVPATRTVLVGWSLGTGVAAEMAKRGLGARLALLSPYTSMRDLAEIKVSSSARRLVQDRFDTFRKAPGIDLPVLIIHGERDRMIPARMGKTLAKRFPKTELWLLPTSGHVVWRPSADAIYDRLARFARGVAAGAGPGADLGELR